MAPKILSSSLGDDYPALFKVLVARKKSLNALSTLEELSLTESSETITQSEELTLSSSCFLHNLFPAAGCPTFGKVSKLCSYSPPLTFSEEKCLYLDVVSSQLRNGTLEKVFYDLLCECVRFEGVANSHSTQALSGEFGAKLHTVYAGYHGRQAVLRATCRLTPSASDNSIVGFHYSLATLLRNSLSFDLTTLGNSPLLNALISLEGEPKFSWATSALTSASPKAFSFFSKPSPIARLDDLERTYTLKVKELALRLASGAGTSIASVVDQSYAEVMQGSSTLAGPKLPLFSFSFVPALILTSSPPVLQLVIYVVIKPRYLAPSLSSDMVCTSLLSSLHATGALLDSPQFTLYRSDAIRLGSELIAKQLDLTGRTQGFLKCPSFLA